MLCWTFSSCFVALLNWEAPNWIIFNIILQPLLRYQLSSTIYLLVAALPAGGKLPVTTHGATSMLLFPLVSNCGYTAQAKKSQYVQKAHIFLHSFTNQYYLPTRTLLPLKKLDKNVRLLTC